MPPTSPAPRQKMTETSTSGPAATPLPDLRKKGGEDQDEKSEEKAKQHTDDDDNDDDDDDDGGDGSEHKGDFPLPKLRLHIQDVAHPGVARFLSAVDASTILSRSVEAVLGLLYISNRHDSK